jgi:hypothetical protein
MKTVNTRWRLITFAAIAMTAAIWTIGEMKARAKPVGTAQRAKASVAELCVATDSEGMPGGLLHFRDACAGGELQLAKFKNQKFAFTVPLGALEISTNPGVPAVLERSDQTTFQTPIFEATTGPNGSADIIDGVIEEGSVYHHDVTLIARTADGRSYCGGWGYTVDHIIGSPTVQIFSTLKYAEGSIYPAPTSEVLAVGNRRILRVHGNGQDTLRWSAVVQRVKILPPGQ